VGEGVGVVREGGEEGAVGGEDFRGREGWGEVENVVFGDLGGV
jgi:hypothetical protein